MRQQATCSCTDSSSTTLHLWRIPSPNLNYPKRSRPGSVARADTRKNILERGSVLAVANHWRHEHEGSTRVFRVEMAQKISNRCHTPGRHPALHTCTVTSRLAEAMRLPSGDQAASKTEEE